MQIILGLGVALLLALGIYITLPSKTAVPVPAVTDTTTMPADMPTDIPSDTQLPATTPDAQPISGVPTTDPSAATPTVPAGVVKEFTIEGGKMYFKPNTMTVSEGDTVRVTFNNVDGFHDFVIDEFKVATQKIQGGKSEVVEFVANKAGTFEYYCSVGSHRAEGMKGALTVTPRE